MAMTRETMTGRMKPITDNPERTAATRSAFLWAMHLAMAVPVFHLSTLIGSQLGDTFVRL